MIDGRGQVSITDFGIACFAEQLPRGEVCQGTPSYMAPEQLSGKEVSVRSDIYCLGLLLYEMFTGERVFQADLVAELLRLHENMLLTNPSFLVKDLDPAVDRIILRCFDPDPRNRPYSALAVSAALPGGDRLAAALAAGEIPSPDAAAGTTAGLPSPVAGWCLAFVVIGLVAVAILSSSVNLTDQKLLERAPDVLVQKARDILQGISYRDRPADSAYGFRYDANPYFRYMEQHDPSRKRPGAPGRTPAPADSLLVLPKPAISRAKHSLPRVNAIFIRGCDGLVRCANRSARPGARQGGSKGPPYLLPKRRRTSPPMVVRRWQFFR